MGCNCLGYLNPGKPFTVRELELWVNNDEDLYNWWKRSHTSLAKFIRSNHSKLDYFVRRKLSSRSELHGIPDTDDRILWDAIAAVATEAPSPQARVYAEHARDAVVEGGSEGLRVQVVYILSNLSAWRGERAKAVKAVLKKYAKR